MDTPYRSEMTKRTVQTTWKLWSYDVWGNARDGYEVNDRSCFDREYSLPLRVEKHNVGTPAEFQSAHPSDVSQAPFRPYQPLPTGGNRRRS